MPDLPQFSTLVHALGWMLIHFLWQGLVIGVVYWLIRKLSRPESSGLRYTAGLAGYLASVVVSALTLLYYLQPTAVAVPAGAELAMPVISVATGYRMSSWQFIQQALEPSLPMIVVLWAIGVTFLSSRTFMGWLGTRRLITSGTESVGDDLLEMAAMLKGRLGIDKAVSVLRSTRVVVPTLIGWLRPVVLLPAGVIASLPREQLEMVIAHELAHVRRNDYLVNLLQLVIETLFFYHPAIRWMSRKVRDEREHCCDDLVVARCGKPVVYARALASLEGLRDPVGATSVLAATGGDLFHRVSRIVRSELPRRNAGFVQVALIAGMAVITSLSAHRGMELASVAAAQEASVTESRIMDASRFGARASPGAGFRRYGELQRQAKAEQQAAARLRADAERRARLEAVQQAERVDRESGAATAEVRKEFRPVRLEELPQDPFLLDKRQTEPLELASLKPLSPAAPEPTARPIATLAPDYPNRAYRDGIEGFVKLQFTVNRKGWVEDIQVLEAHPARIFDAAAVKALKRWRFEVDYDHDTDQPMIQTFDFAMVEQQENDSRRGLRCRRTGSRICTHHYSEEQVADFWEANRTK